MNIARMQAAVKQLVEFGLPEATVVWSPSELPRSAAGDVVSLRVLTGPDLRPGSHQVFSLPGAVTITVPAATANALYTIYETGATWRHEAGATPTVTTIRDALLALLQQTAIGSDASPTAVSTGAIALDDPGHTGLLWDLAVSSNLSMAVADEFDAQASTSEAITQVEVQCHSRSRYPRQGAMRMMASILSAYQHPQAIEILESLGVSRWGLASPPVDLTQLSLDGWESRSACQFSVAQRAFTARPAYTIGGVAVSFGEPSVDFVVEE